jgi:hypothetical protein
MNVVLWVVGEPGLGKTTLIRGLLNKLDPHGSRSFFVKPKWTIVPGKLALAGHYTGGPFDGADTIPYNGAQAALDYWAATSELHTCPLTILDGDRLSHAGALTFFSNGPKVVQCVVTHLIAVPTLGAARRVARGSKQPDSWVKSRATKATRFADLFDKRLTLNAAHEPDVMLDGFCTWLRTIVGDALEL